MIIRRKRTTRDDGAYRAFIRHLNSTACEHFRRTRGSNAHPLVKQRFRKLVAERLRDAFPEHRFEAFLRDSAKERADAEHLARIYADEILGPFSGEQIDGH